MILAFAIHIPLILFICLYLRKRYISEPLSKYYWPSLIIKLFAGCMVGLLYIFFYKNYEGDTLQYQKYANWLTDIFKKDTHEYFRIFFFNKFSDTTIPLYKATKDLRFFLLVKIISLINLFTFNNYWINTLYFSLFSFAGLWSLGNKIQKSFKFSSLSIFLSFFLLPSFVFWTSGILKETITIGIIAFITSIFITTIFENKPSILKTFIFLSLLFIGWKIKFFYFAILIPLMISLTLIQVIGKKYTLNERSKNFILISFLFISTILFLIFTPQTYIQYLLDIMYISYEAMLPYTSGKNFFTFKHIEPTLISYLINTPLALFTGLFRPFIGEVEGGLALLAGAENLLIIILFIGKIFQIIKSKKFRVTSTALSLLLYVCIMAALMAFVAPVWGTLIRYKSGFLMFFILLIVEDNPLINFLKKNLKSIG